MKDKAQSKKKTQNKKKESKKAVKTKKPDTNKSVKIKAESSKISLESEKNINSQKKHINKKTIVLTIGGILLIIIIGIIIFLSGNETFFKNKYIGVTNKEIFVPRFSYFKVDSGMYTAEFHSLKSKKALEKEISNYLETLSYYVDTETSGYRKDDLVIYSYTVEDKGWYREILISYN